MAHNKNYDLETSEGHKSLLEDIVQSKNEPSPAKNSLSKFVGAQSKADGPNIRSVEDWLSHDPGYLKSSLFDASAIVKLLVIDGTDMSREAARNGWNRFAPVITTTLCYAEVLGVLKRKYLNGLKGKPDAITPLQYFGAIHELHVMIEHGMLKIEGGIASRNEVDECQDVTAKNPKIDFSDAFQIITLRGLKLTGTWILCTGDGTLAKVAAEHFDLRVALL